MLFELKNGFRQRQNTFFCIRLLVGICLTLLIYRFFEILTDQNFPKKKSGLGILVSGAGNTSRSLDQLSGFNGVESFGGKEIFSLAEYINVFDLKDIQKTAPIFDPIKLEWLNGEYIRKTQNSNLKTQILDFYRNKNINLDKNLAEKTVPLIKERIKKISDYLPLCEFFFQPPATYEVDLTGKNTFFERVYRALEKVTDWKAISIGEAMQKLASELKIKNSQFFMDLRIAITGKKISPPLNESMEILGKSECLNRIKKLL
jgi:glutamyl-tRNA synthetase